MTNIIKLKTDKRFNGEIYICLKDDGRYIVVHESRCGGSSGILGQFVDIGAALASARHSANTMGAEYLAASL